MANSFSLSFALPPSLNNAFPTVNGRRIVSREYKAWKALAAKSVAEQIAQLPRSPNVGKHYSLHYRFNVNHKSDVCNREKAATDLLVAMKIIPDDCWCDRVVIERDRSIEGAHVLVEAKI